MDSEEIRSLASRAWNTYKAHKDKKFVCSPAIPILFFGDFDAYTQTTPKVITVGLNPSHHEFPPKDRFQRFRKAEGIPQGEMREDHYRQYIEALSDYFTLEPYWKWFRFNEDVLKGMDASYYPGKTSMAVHTDLYSPIATKPTWTGLSEQEKMAIGSEGTPLWHDLVKVLRPDIVVASIGKEHFPKIRFPTIRQRTESVSLGEQSYSMEFSEIKINDEKRAMLVTGLASRRPFMKCKAEHREKVGQFIKDQLREFLKR